MIQRLAPLPRGTDENIQLLAHLRLADKLNQTTGTQTAIKGMFIAGRPRQGRNNPFFTHNAAPDNERKA